MMDTAINDVLLGYLGITVILWILLISRTATEIHVHGKWVVVLFMILLLVTALWPVALCDMMYQCLRGGNDV